jgi:predicted sugar kinase
MLVRPRGERGLSGDAEREAFSALPPVPLEMTAALCHEIAVHLLPAADEGRFEEFSESLYRFGHQAGLCFAGRQGGAYASPRLAALVETIRGLGVRGVGQTSWGPTLFALLADQAAAAAFVERLRARLPDEQLELSIAAPDNRGARIEVEACGEESR